MLVLFTAFYVKLFSQLQNENFRILIFEFLKNSFFYPGVSLASPYPGGGTSDHGNYIRKSYCYYMRWDRIGKNHSGSSIPLRSRLCTVRHSFQCNTNLMHSMLFLIFLETVLLESLNRDELQLWVCQSVLPWKWIYLPVKSPTI